MASFSTLSLPMVNSPAGISTMRFAIRLPAAWFSAEQAIPPVNAKQKIPASKCLIGIFGAPEPNVDQHAIGAYMAALGIAEYHAECIIVTGTRHSAADHAL